MKSQVHHLDFDWTSDPADVRVTHEDPTLTCAFERGHMLQTLTRREHGDPDVSTGAFLSLLDTLRDPFSVELLVSQSHTHAQLRSGIEMSLERDF